METYLTSSLTNKKSLYNKNIPSTYKSLLKRLLWAISLSCLTGFYFYCLSDFYILSSLLRFIKIFYEKNSKKVLTLTRFRVIINT